MRRHAAGAVLGLGLVAFLVSSCSATSLGMIRASATFTDIGSLIVGAPVDMADVQVGTVSEISLDGTRARVELTIQQSARVPSDVTAQVKVSSLLGQNLVELVPGQRALAIAAAGGRVALLHDGARIARAEVVPGIQQLVQYGSSVFGAVNASQLAQLIGSEAQGFGNQAESIRQLLNSFATTANGYAGQTETISALVATMNQLSSSLAPDAAPDAAAISNLAQSTSVLAEQSQNLNGLLQSLQGLAVSSRSLLDVYIPDITTDFGTLDAVSQAIDARLSDLSGFLTWLPRHNQTLSEAVSGSYVQILDDVVTCGLPGNAQANSAAGSCKGAH